MLKGVDKMAKIGLKSFFNLMQSYIVGLNSRSVDYVQGAQLTGGQTVPLTNYEPMIFAPLNDLRSNTYLYQPLSLNSNGTQIQFAEGVQFVAIEGTISLIVKAFEGTSNFFIRVTRHRPDGTIVTAGLYRHTIFGQSADYNLSLSVNATGLVSDDYYTVDCETSQAVAENKITINSGYFKISTSTRPRHNSYTDKVLWD